MVSYEYDQCSRLSHLVDGDREIHYQYDTDGRLTEKNYPGGISSNLGNKTGIRKTRKAGDSSMPREMEHKLQKESGYYKYRYDSLDRLTEVSRNDNTLRRYHYDAYGNRIRQEKEAMWERYHYNAANQLIRTEGIFPEESYQYDARGNLTTITHGKEVVNQYTYDETNRLSTAMNGNGEAATYQYDGLGNRVGMQEYLMDRKLLHSSSITPSASPLFEHPTKEIDYLLDRTKAYHNLLEKTEVTEGSSSTQTYTWDGNAAFMTEGETAHLYLQDELGSPVRLVEMGENKQTVYGYDEFGQDLYGTQGDVQPFGYTGYRKDSIANTYFAQAREYLAGVGRFGGEDKAKGYISNPITLNNYEYCLNSPICFVDSNGLWPEEGCVLGDEKGDYLYRNYLYGDGSSEYIYDWGDYMMENELLTSKTAAYLIPIGMSLEKGQGVSIDFSIPMEMIPNDANPDSGHTLLYGANSNVGGYRIQGGIYKHLNGSIEYDMKYTWNDIMDPNKKIISDTIKVGLLKVINAIDPNANFTLNAYDIHISWNDITTISQEHPNLNSGWLMNYDKYWVKRLEDILKIIPTTFGDGDLKNTQKSIRPFIEHLENWKKAHPELYRCENAK